MDDTAKHELASLSFSPSSAGSLSYQQQYHRQHHDNEYDNEAIDSPSSFGSPSSLITARPQYELDTEADTSLTETIAVIGGHGPTGQAFCRKALDAGYQLQVLQSSAHNVWESLEGDSLRVIKGALNDVDTLETVLHGAVYVVCLLGDAFTTVSKQKASRQQTPLQEYDSGLLRKHIETIYPLMKESYTRVFLYQVRFRSKNSMQSWIRFGSSTIRATV